MGVVLRARDPQLGHALAVKVLLEEYRGRPELERRFREEAQVTAQLQHPGVPPVHEVGALEDGRPFLAMKLIRGRALADLLKERRGSSEDLPRFLGIFEQVCQTVAYAHSKGALHRDLKPGNVMVGAFGEVQVMNWGLAKVLSQPAATGPGSTPPGPEGPGAVRTVRSGTAGAESAAGTVLGTLAYMAPEAARGEVEQLDARCDVFGLGAVLYEVLTGQPAAAVAGVAGRGGAVCAGRGGAAGGLAALWQLARGDRWRRLQEVRRGIKPATEPVLTVVLLAQASSAVGDAAAAEQVLRQALAARPEQVVLLGALGRLLERQGRARLEEAIGWYRAARAVRPQLGVALGQALVKAGRAAEGEVVLRDLVRRQPNNPDLRISLGNALAGQKKLAEAEAAFRKAIEFQPDLAAAHTNLGNALGAQGKLVEAEVAYRKAIDLQPDSALAYNNLGIALGEQRKHGEAEAACRKAIDLQPDSAEAYVNLGVALLRQAQFKEALAALKKGRDLLPARGPRREQVRRLVELCQRQVILDARLPAVRGGTEKPASATEQIEFAQLCALKKLYPAAARFYRDAFAADPTLAKDLVQRHRYHAACAAALAAAVRGEDTAKLGGEERAGWWRYALTWLRPDLAAWTQVVEQGPPQARPVVQRALRHWQTDPDLGGLREKAALAELPEAERQACRKLWAEVAALLERAQAKE
jgi:tetratricopeptide (TPR) repeat protein